MANHENDLGASVGGEKNYFHGLRNNLALKFVTLFGLTLLLLVPLGMIKSQIVERAGYQRQVTTEIAATSAGTQTLTGPLLAIRYRTKTLEGQNRDQTHEFTAIKPARTLTVRGKTDVESRYRGIYQARLFHLDAQVEGMFELDADTPKVPEGDVFLDAEVAILFGISDLRGMDIDPEVLVDGQPMHFRTPANERFKGLMPSNWMEVGLGAWQQPQTRKITFSFPLRLSGTETLAIAPTAENNVVELQSPWRHPGFQGRFLPRERSVDGKGFTARWEISQLARDLHATLKPGSNEQLRIAFMDPVNIYLQAERAVKYGSLFIVLTFAALFIGEILRRRPLHIMQYLLVGLALAIFFLLLIALSEHLPFMWSYLAAALACVGLIFVYLAGVFRSWRRASGFGGGLAGLYGMLFVILRQEDQALLMGSLLLFAVLAAIMLSTRSLDWYGLAGGEKAVEG